MNSVENRGQQSQEKLGTYAEITTSIQSLMAKITASGLENTPLCRQKMTQIQELRKIQGDFVVWEVAEFHIGKLNGMKTLEHIANRMSEAVQRIEQIRADFQYYLNLEQDATDTAHVMPQRSASKAA